MGGVVVLEDAKGVWKAVVTLARISGVLSMGFVEMHTPIPRPPAQNNQLKPTKRPCHRLREAMAVFVDPRSQHALVEQWDLKRHRSSAPTADSFCPPLRRKEAPLV
jgi:hypothetical protein